MVNLILFDDPSLRTGLFPLTLTRPLSEIRVGILTLTKKWEKYLGVMASFGTANYLQKRYPLHTSDTHNLWVNGAICPTPRLIQAITSLSSNSSLVQDKLLIASRNTIKSNVFNQEIFLKKTHCITYDSPIRVVDCPRKIIEFNASQIKDDYALLTATRKSMPIDDPHTILYGDDLFIEKNVQLKAAILNAEKGPIYLGQNSQVQEGAIIQGPFALCEGGQVMMGCRVRENTTVGPYSRIGGEISNSVLFGYSNKSHDGFLGHSVLGEWCNLGAGTTTSNLKNNYKTVRVWDYEKKDFSDTGVQFYGLTMGDHSKCSINTMFNTGTVVGVGSNIFGSGFPSQFIPSFTWGGRHDFTTHKLASMIETASLVMLRRGISLDDTSRQILEQVFIKTAEYRSWKKGHHEI